MPDSHYRQKYEDALHQFDLFRAKTRERNEVLNKTLPALSVDTSSPDGAVSLSVNAEGVLTRLQLSDQVRRLSPAEIADAVFRTYNSAQRDAAHKAAELLISAFGENGYVQDRLRWRLEFEPMPRIERRTRLSAETEENFELNTYLRRA